MSKDTSPQPAPQPERITVTPRMIGALIGSAFAAVLSPVLADHFSGSDYNTPVPAYAQPAPGYIMTPMNTVAPPTTLQPPATLPPIQGINTGTVPSR